MEKIVCVRCGSIDDYTTEKSGPHIKAICNGCGYYIKFIKQNKLKIMAADKIIHGRILIEKLNRDWFFKGQNGTYIDFTMFYTEEQTVTMVNGKEVRQNGMIVQTVPKVIFDADKGKPVNERTQGAILGNCLEFKKGGAINAESVPGASASPATPKSNDPFAQTQTSQPQQQTPLPNASDITEPISNLPF